MCTIHLRPASLVRNGIIMGNRISIHVNSGVSEEAFAELQKTIETLQKQIADTQRQLAETQQQLKHLETSRSAQEKPLETLSTQDQQEIPAVLEGKLIDSSDSGASSPRVASTPSAGQYLA